VHYYVSRLGNELQWHGALSLDYILQEENQVPIFIDANPRLVEPMNAVFSGVNLADILVRVSTGEPVTTAEPSGREVQTHMLLMALLSKAAARARRLDVIVELIQQLQGAAYMQAAGRNYYRCGLISQRGADKILSGKLKLGAGASAVAGPSGANAAAFNDPNVDILSYSQSKGLFAGASLGTASMASDDDANKDLYGKDIDAAEMVRDGQTTIPPAAQPLIDVLKKASAKGM
jgi:Las17-binding protein actin regulator